MTIRELEKRDSSFNSNIFISKANNMIKKLYNAVTLDGLDTVDHFASDEVFNKFKDELEMAKASNKKLAYNQVNISTEIKDIEEVDGMFKIICSVRCKYYKNCGSSVEEMTLGDSRTEVYKKAIFCKKIGAEQEEITRCLGCGASLNINASGKCPNCGRIYELENHDYYLDYFG